jgi:hypothetical protein
MKTYISLACRSLLGLGLAAALSGCVTPGPAPSLMQQLDSTLRQSAPDRRVGLRLSAETIRIGETLAAEVRSEQAGYVYLFQLSSDGRELNLVFPNSLDGANYVGAGQSLALPRPNWRLRAQGPAGVGYLMTVVTQEQQDLMALPAKLKEGQIALKGSYAAAMAPLRELAP